MTVVPGLGRLADVPLYLEKAESRKASANHSKIVRVIAFRMVIHHAQIVIKLTIGTTFTKKRVMTEVPSGSIRAATANVDGSCKDTDLCKSQE